MAYYHVLLVLSDTPDKETCVFSDLSEDDLKRRFLYPYQHKSDLLCDRNEIVEANRIRKVRIVRTEQSSVVELARIQAESKRQIDDINRTSSSIMVFSIGRGHDPEDIAEAGADVTAFYVSGPPGSGSSWRFAANHPWITGIGTAVIAAGIAKGLGWM